LRRSQRLAVIVVAHVLNNSGGVQICQQKTEQTC
jgi:hypothetical protein